MPKLRTILPLIGKIKPMLGAMPGNEQSRSRFRNQRDSWRAWYKTARWQRLRLKVFERDGYRCQRSGDLCIGRHPAPNSPVANHIVPHRGDETLFWDIDNIETVTKQIHDGLIQSEERAAEAAAVWG